MNLNCVGLLQVFLALDFIQTSLGKYFRTQNVIDFLYQLRKNNRGLISKLKIHLTQLYKITNSAFICGKLSVLERQLRTSDSVEYDYFSQVKQPQPLKNDNYFITCICFPKATITKCPKLGGLKQQKFIFIVLKARKV